MRRLIILTVLPMLAAACADASAAEPNPNSLVPIVVANRDLPAGSTVTRDDISQRSVPAGLVTTSIVRPDSASYINNQKLLLPVLAGDAMQWSYFESLHSELLEPCARFGGEDLSAEQQVARARQIVLLHGR